jgi:hypothetical protein
MSAKPWLESLDLLVKIVITVVVFLIWGSEKERLTIQKQQIEIQKEQAATEQTLAESAKVKQEMNLAIVDKLITILSGFEQQCLSEDRHLFVEYLIQVNDAYSKVPFPPGAQDVIFGAHKNCGGNSLPTVDQASYAAIKPSVAEKVEQLPASKESPDGYVALGVFDKNQKSYRNFRIASGASEDGLAKDGTIMKANWSVYLRANTENTEGGANPSLGIIPEGGCIRIIERRDNIRGQTWAAVKLAKCA